MSTQVAVFVGSLRKGSYNRQLARILVGLAPTELELKIVEIGELPLYNPDLDETAPPPAWTAFRDQVKAADAVLFVTPEYNRSVPAALKNALDVGSRPYGHNVWAGKPGAVVSSSPGGLSAFGANHHLRQSLVFLDVPTLQQPEMYLGHVDKLIGEDGQLVNEDTKKFLTSFLEKFAKFIARNRRD